MKNLIFLVTLALSLPCLLFSPALAHEIKAGSLEIVHPHAPAMLPGAAVGGGFMTIINHGTADDRLLSVTTDRSGKVELHQMSMENDVIKMRALKDGIPLPAGKTVKLSHGGAHVMFKSVADPFVEGETFDATLHFETAGAVEVEFHVDSPDGKGGDDDSAHQHHATGN